MYFTVFEENICWSIYLLRVVWFCLLHVSSVVTAFSKDQGNLIRNGCTKGICDCGSFRSHAWICDGNVADTSVYGAAGNRNKSCTYLINSLTICYNIFFYLIRILSWYKFIASSANEALRVEFSTFLKLYVELRASQGNRLLGKFTSNFAWGSAQTKENGFLGSVPQTLRGSGAPRKLRDKPNPSSHGHGCCVSSSGLRAY